MAFHGRDKSRTGGDPDESIPLTSDQDGMNLDSTPSSGSLVAEILANGAEDGPPRSLIMRSVSTEPIISRGVTLDDENVTRLSFLHDEVEKIFDTDWRFDSTTLTTDPNSKAQALNLMGRESSKLSLSESYHVDEAEYSRHRKVSYPHIHQPLRSLSNKSLSKSHKSHKEKKKAKKKKKKEKLRSFPSQGAIKSPTIPEEEEEHFDLVDDDSDSESSSVTDDDEYDEEYNRENEQDTSSKQEPYETTIELKIQPATPSPAEERDVDIELDKSKLPEPRPKDAVDFFIGADFPSPISESQEQPFPVASTPFIASQPASSSVHAASDEETGFMSDPGLSSFSEEIALQTLKKSMSEEPGNFNSKQEVEEATPSFRPAYLALDVADDRGTPSPMAHMPPREQSLTGKVTFVVGDDSSYPSYAAFQTQMAGTVPDVEQGGEPSGGDEEDDDDDKENVWKRKKRRDSGGHRRESTEGYTQESETHELQRVPSVEGSQSTRSSKRRHHHHHEHFHREDLIMRRQKGSEVKLDQTFKKSPTEIEEASMLYKSDLDEMASHRFEDQRGIRRHKIARSKGALRSIVHIGKSHHIKKHKVVKKFDHSPHEVFVELDELHIGSEDMWEWREKARWIKFEEDVEEGAERWGKPHVASLSFHSLLELRRGLENGTVLLDLEATDLTSIIHNVTENMVIRDLVEEEVKGKLLRTLLLKHKHVSGRSAFLRRNPSYSNLTSLDNAGKRHQQNHEKGLLNSLSQSSFGSNLGLSKSASTTSVMDRKNKDNKAAAKLEMVKVDVDNNMPAQEECCMLCSKLDYGTISTKPDLKHRKRAHRNCQADKHVKQANGYTPQEGTKWLREESSSPKLSQSFTREELLEDCMQSSLTDRDTDSQQESEAANLKENETMNSCKETDAAVTTENGTVTTHKENDESKKTETVICHNESYTDICKENGTVGAHTEDLSDNLEEKVVPVSKQEDDYRQEDVNNKGDLVEDSGTSQGKTLSQLDCTPSQTTSMEPIVTDKQTDGIHIGITPVEQKKHVQDIMRRIPKGAEASNVLVGQVDFLKKPAMAFVRLAEGQLLENLTEVPLPVRFLFILLGPEKGGMDYHEVGRSFATLMSNQQFHGVAYRAESREDLLRAINSFLDDSIVLPPGDWDHRTLLPITHMARKRAQMRKQKKQQLDEKEALLEKEDIPADPLKRTGCLFGGVYNDIRRRYPHYLSDIKDAANGQCIKTLFFIFFTCLSPCIAFGGLLSEKTNSYMGVSETMLATSIFGMIFSLFSGQPLLIIGATGPVLVFEESLYKFCTSNSLEFLPLRFWIGLWVFAITTLAVALEGSFLVRYVTRFVEEIFAILISLIFIYEVVKKLVQIFSENPLMVDYCQHKANKTSNETFGYNSSLEQSEQGDNYSYVSIESTPSSTLALYTSPLKPDHEKNQPNTALLSLILVFGTFLIAYFLRIFRNSKFLGRSVRRALGDFGVLIALVCMVVLSFIMKETYVQKLDMTDPLEPTSPDKRGWFINPMGVDQPMPVWLIFGSALPGFLIFILLFMETQITEMILNKKERKLKKGSGYHIDQLILGFLTFLGGLFGLPWMCAATVRTVAHISALSEYSSTHAPGEKPQLLGVKEQRVTNFCVHLLIGVSVAAGPVLREVPVPALFGVFLYLGVSTLNGVQMFERIKLLFMPVKYHPSVVYVRKVRTSQMHKFTLIQLACLIILIVIKSTAAALAFPFLLVLLMPLRLKLVSRWFSKDELEHLDMEEEDFELDDEDDPDFYQQAHMPI